MSASVEKPIQTLNGDYIVNVTLRHTNSPHESAHVDFIRRLPPDKSDDEATAYGYFMSVPPQTVIMVNGQTYNSLDSQLMIGPLQELPIFELLSQPLFFFRTQADLNFYTKKVATNRASKKELEDRDKNGSIEEELTEVTWQSLSASSQDSPASRPTSRQMVRVNTSLDSGLEEWTDEAGDAIANPCNYLKRQLWASQHDPYDELIPRVLASINHRQPQNSGFSFTYKGQIYRRERTSITSAFDDVHHVLHVARRTGNDKSVFTTHGLDPMTWITTQSRRTRLFRTITGDDREAGDRALVFVNWAPCAQHTDRHRASTFTVLNAWALALNLKVNPAFSKEGLEEEAFFLKAHYIISSALQDSLDWKLLLAFLRCSQYVVDQRPPQDRRFRQSGRLFTDALEFENNIDSVPQADDQELMALSIQTGISKQHTQRFASDKFSTADLGRVAYLVNQGTWACDDSASALLRRANQEDPDRSSQPKLPIQELKGDSKGSLNGNKAPAPPLPNATAPPKKEKITLVTLPESFNPCGYLKEKMDLVNASTGSEQVKKLSLNFENVYSSVSEVAGQINILHSENGGFAVLGPGDKAISSSNDPGRILDRTVLMPWVDTTGHVIIVAAQASNLHSKSKLPTLHAFDPAPWTVRVSKRSDLRPKIGKKLEQWFPSKNIVLGPYQKEDWQSPYFAVLNAWTLLLGCTLNFDFDPNIDFFHDAHQLIGLTVAGRADWRLIYVFLRCKQYIMGVQLPAKGRWFSSKHASSEDATSSSYGLHDRIDEEVPPLPLYDFDARPISGRKRSHDRSFHSQAYANWDEKDIATRTPEVGRFGHNIGRMRPAELRSVYDELRARATRPQNSNRDFPGDTTPCAYVRAELDILLAYPDIKQRLGSLRSLDTVTYEEADAERWLLRGEVFRLRLEIFLSGSAAMRNSFPDGTRDCSTDELVEGTLLLFRRDSTHSPKLLSRSPAPNSPAIMSVGSTPSYTDGLLPSAWSSILMPSLTGQTTITGYSICHAILHISHLTRIGLAHWRLTYGFLRCRRFVDEGDVPLDRRFTNTVQLDDKPALKKYLENLIIEETTQKATNN